jgi:D-sedoheptulose 7-phosphate isomerase
VEADRELVSQAMGECAAVLEALRGEALASAIAEAAAAISDCLESGGKVLLFGNGGSAADATHIAGEFVGRFLRERPAAAALSLSDNSSAVTAIANDYGFEAVFARQVEGLGRAGDVAVAISTSGNSANVLAGVRAARNGGMRTIALTGAGGGALAGEVDLLIAVPSSSTPRIQEAHSLIAHVLCDLVERRMS